MHVQIAVILVLIFVAAQDHLPAVGKDLRNLSKAQVTELGIQMGLSYRWLKDHESSGTFRYDMVDAWLKKQDSVAEICPPTWQNLVATLREVEHNSVADQVSKDQGIYKYGWDTKIVLTYREA